MADKKIGNANIAITASSDGLDKTVVKSKKKLQEVGQAAKDASKTAAKSPAVAAPDTDAAAKELADFDKKIGETISNLYRLRKDAKTGVKLSVSGDALTKSIDKIVNSGVVSPKDQRSMLAKIWGFSPGKAGGELLKKFTGAELVPESLAENSFVGGTMMALGAAKAVGTAGVVNRNAFDRDKGDGRSATFGDQWTNVVESMPVVGGIVKSLKEDLMDAFSSARQESELVATAMEGWLALEEKRKAIKAESRQIERETMGMMFHARQDIDSIGDSAGVQGRSHQIDRERDGVKFDAAQKRDAAIEALNKERGEAAKDWQKQTKELRNTIANSKDAGLVATARQQLSGLTATRNATLKELDGKQAKIEGQYANTAAVADEKAEKLKSINETGPKLDEMNALFEQVQGTIDTLGVDELDRMAKAFAQTRPPSDQVAAYNVKLAELKDKQDQIEGQSLWKKMTDDLKDYADMTADEVAKAKLMTGGKSAADADDLIRRQKASQTIAGAKGMLDGSGDGLAYQNEKERILSQLGLAGADDALVARVKLSLDTKDAGERYRAFMAEMKSLNMQLQVEAAGPDERRRAHAEIDAQRDDDLKTISDPELRKNRINEAAALKKKSDEVWAARRANAMTDDADTKAKYQRRIDEIGELLKAGKITEATARDQVKKTTADYDAANMPRANADLLSWDSGGFQRMILSQTQGITDSSNPELAEAKKTNDILTQIQQGNKPQIANF